MKISKILFHSVLNSIENERCEALQIETFNDFITPSPIQVGDKPTTSPVKKSQSTNKTEEDFFDTNEGKATTDAGLTLAIGVIVREALQKWSNNFFSNYFSKHPDVNKDELIIINNKMLADKIKESKNSAFKNIHVEIAKSGQDAYFDHINNRIRVTMDTLISLPHEIGHAVQEHSTKIFRTLQRNRGNYTILALLLYGIGRSKPTNKKGEKTTFSKIQNLLYKYNVIVPLLAFSPELITEFKASQIGIDYLKNYTKEVETQLKKKPTNKSLMQKAANSKSILKAAKKHYAIAFCTYLSLPVFTMLDNFIIDKSGKI